LQGDVDIAQRRVDDARRTYTEARQTFERLLQRSPETVDYGVNLARVEARLAAALDAPPRAEGASELRGVALRRLDQLEREGRLFPEDQPLLRELEGVLHPAAPSRR
ncbi:MAG TPA: hypothetical protein VNN80_03470, partial [Polyangiaceae bacterium]|nr:hypothetical protein [Polyangiaceae bacterium]